MNVEEHVLPQRSSHRTPGNRREFRCRCPSAETTGQRTSPRESHCASHGSGYPGHDPAKSVLRCASRTGKPSAKHSSGAGKLLPRSSPESLSTVILNPLEGIRLPNRLLTVLHAVYGTVLAGRRRLSGTKTMREPGSCAHRPVAGKRAARDSRSGQPASAGPASSTRGRASSRAAPGAAPSGIPAGRAPHATVQSRFGSPPIVPGLILAVAPESRYLGKRRRA